VDIIHVWAVVQGRMAPGVSLRQLQDPVTSKIIGVVRSSVPPMVGRTVVESPQPHPRGP